jgi:hypothetical protein
MVYLKVVMTYKTIIGKEKYHMHNEIMQWCNDHIGDGGYTQQPNPLWDMVLVYGTATYYFKHERDLVFFTLRWS